MKDAFGGTFMLRIMIAFFVIFICFMTVAVSLSRTYAVKNGIINILEKNSGVLDTDNEIAQFLRSRHYAYETHTGVAEKCVAASSAPSGALNGNIHGVCIVPYGDDDSFYYVVTVYIVIDFPLFHSGLIIPIKGETITIIQ